LALLRTPSAGVAADSIFHSRLPSVSPAVLLAAGLVLTLVGLRRRRLGDSPRELLALACAAAPLAVNLQQTVTGMMVSPKTWENYSDYLFLTAGLTAAIPPGPWTARGRWAGRATALVLVGLLGLGRARTYDLFQASNVATLAGARALARTDTTASRVLLDHLDQHQGLAARLGHRFVAVSSSWDVMIAGQTIDRMPAGGGEPRGRALHQRRTFERYARTGLSPAQLAAELAADIDAGSAGRHLLRFFSLLDAMPTITGNRAVPREAMRQQAHAIVAAYRAYLDGSPAEWREPVLYLTSLSPLQAALNPRFEHALVAQAAAGQLPAHRAYVYRQTLRAHPEFDPGAALRQWVAERGQPVTLVAAATGVTLAPAPTRGGGSATLPASIWTAAVAHGNRVEQHGGGLLVTTGPARYGYALMGPPTSAAIGGRYAFILSARVLEGDLTFGALIGDRTRWLTQASRYPAAASDGEALWVLDLDLSASDRLVLVIANHQPSGERPSTFLLRGLEAVRYEAAPAPRP
jgi:hypothetical protein